LHLLEIIREAYFQNVHKKKEEITKKKLTKIM